MNNPKKRQDGIRTVDDLKARCKVNDETGCWMWAGARHHGSARVWLPGIGAQAIPFALHYLRTGTRPEKGAMLVPICGNTDCANPAHRKLGNRSVLQSTLRPKLDPLHKARIGKSKRAISPIYSPEAHADILASNEPGDVLAKRWGMHKTHIGRIKRGEAWALTREASVFAWRPAA